MKHSAKELRYSADILSGNQTCVMAGVGCGISDLSGSRLNLPQIEGKETTHMVLFRYADLVGVDISSAYIRVTDPGSGVTSLYIADYPQDAYLTVPPRAPRARVWTEVYCHAGRAGN